VGAAVAGSRPLEPFETASLAGACALLVGVAAIAFVEPRILAWPIGAIAAWIATTLADETWDMWRRH
jgi:hypothetical protein